MPIKFLKKSKFNSLLEEKASLKSQIDFATTIAESLVNDNFTNNTIETNETQLSTLLINLQKKLVQIKQDEVQNKWIADGITLFLELEKKYSEDIHNFSRQFCSTLINYIQASQIGIFKLSIETNDLELICSYAFSKEKFNKKNIKIGEGLLGQCFIDKKTQYFDTLPTNYAKITSGLGEAIPTHLLLVPAKIIDEAYGVIEIASFKQFLPYQINFIEQVVESFAYIFRNHDAKNQTLKLLKDSQLLSEDLRGRDEEMRQNLEEISATQEEMSRNKIEIENQRNLLYLTIDAIPFPIFIKNQNGFYTMANKAQANLFGLERDQIIGRKDDDFITNKTELEEIYSTDKQVINTNKLIELPLQNFSLHSGDSFIFKTTKMPFLNTISKNIEVLGVSVDITEKISNENRKNKEKKIVLNNYTIDLAGRQRMLSQKIAFVSLLVSKGNESKKDTLTQAVELFDHSLNVIKNGGVPKNMQSEQKLEPANESLYPILNLIEENWIDFKKCTSILLETNDANKIKFAIDFIENNADNLLQLCDKSVKELSESSKNLLLNN